jgi:hypothetical protein
MIKPKTAGNSAAVRADAKIDFIPSKRFDRKTITSVATTVAGEGVQTRIVTGGQNLGIDRRISVAAIDVDEAIICMSL